ncbi:MAG: gliding motility-associated C-terminal domain-containing protein [Bacteroidales bacterium]|jgi:gliding motility-associated-like protein|nr:gliding motility-associated C-terminal domain-containing protein [Bacteroidales bacterium]
MRNVIFVLLFLMPLFVLSQTPTNQDCLGAIPVCQYTYTQSNSYSGTGNYTDEISTSGCPGSCLLSGEKNDVWYIFTVQTSGNLNFNITPNSSSDDYDWAVYNLTNANCDDIYSNPSLQVSCNYSATPGTTGANGGSSLNCADAMDGNDNAVIPVTAGQTYALNISNYSSTQYGYTLDFGPSSASIFDNSPPVFQSVNLPIACGATQITFNFSENVMCSSVLASDFQVTGPGATYTSVSISSAACSSGADMDNTFTLTVSPAMTTSGNYQICMVSTVTDACGNAAALGCFSFVVSGVSTNITTVDANCGPNGSATVTPYGGSGTYTYLWSTTPAQTTATATGLAAGIYYVTVSDGACSAIDTATIIDNGGPQLTINGTTDYCNQGLGTASVSASGGSGTYTYLWSNGATTSNISGLITGTYSVTVDDGGLCPSVASYTVGNVAGPALSLGSSTPENYGMQDGTAVVSTSGGTAPITITWDTSPVQTGTSASGLSTGNYTVIATDASGCSDTLIVFIGLSTNTYLTVSTTPEHCGHADGTATVVVHNNVGSYTISWNTTPAQTSETISNLTPGAYTVTMTDSIGTYSNVAYVTLAPGPNASFYANPNPATIGGGPIQFINSSSGASNYEWSFGDGTTSVEQYPSHLYGGVGEYLVTLLATDNFGCRDSFQLTIIINDLFAFYIPNAFSPNGDGHNDFFMPYGISVDLDYYEMRIYNRWGNLVFNTTQANIPWDGNINGKIVKEKLQDTYTYEIFIKDASNIIHKYRGKVTLLY